jgi:fucose permease
VAFVLVVTAAGAVAVATLPSQPLGADTGSDPGPATGTARSLTGIFAVVGLEFTLSFWAASYLHDDVGLARDTSVALVSALYAANLVGRVLASRVARRRPAPTVLLACLATALAGVPVLLLAETGVVAVCGLAVVGIGTGGTFPLASALHVEASHRSADQALGQTLAVAGLGQIAGPLAAGAIAQLADLRVGLLVLAALVLLAAASTWPSGGVARPAAH